MPYLVDTCTISELVAKTPDRRAIEFIINLPGHELYLSAVTIGELQKGIHELPPCPRRIFLEVWLENHILVLYAERIFHVDISIARRWGILSADMKRRGLTMQISDSILAATALVHGLTLVTRNEFDFAHTGVSILNPWK